MDMYALFDYDPIEKQIEEEFIKNAKRGSITYPADLVEKTGKPYREIEPIVLKVHQKLGLSIHNVSGDFFFYITKESKI